MGRAGRFMKTISDILEIFGRNKEMQTGINVKVKYFLPNLPDTGCCHAFSLSFFNA